MTTRRNLLYIYNNYTKYIKSAFLLNIMKPCAINKKESREILKDINYRYRWEHR